MRILGKLAGGAIGYMAAGPFGALVGVALGHQFFDNAPRTFFGIAMSEKETKNSVFFAATFSMLGKLAQADDTVSEAELDALEDLFESHFKLSYSSKKFARKVFDEAIHSETTFEEHARAFYSQFKHETAVLESMLEIMLEIAHADLHFDEDEEALIISAVEIFGLTSEYDHLRQSFIAEADTLEQSYEILGCAPSDDMQTIEHAFEVQLALHEPKRLLAEGMPKELSRISEDQYIRIRNAFDRIYEDRFGDVLSHS